MRKLDGFRAAAAAIAVVVSSAAASHAAERVTTLPCAFPSAVKGDASAPFCLSVHNTCNAPITSTMRDDTAGTEVNTPSIPAGESDQACGQHPLRLVGHTIGGP